MAILSNIILFFALAAAVVFSLLVLLTGKGDAMSGGGSVRTNYKGKATFDDIMSKAALYLGVSFMALVLIYSVISKRVLDAEMKVVPGQVSTPQPETNTPAVSNNAPAVSNNAPAATNNAPAATNTPAPANNTPAATNSPAPSTPTSNNAPASSNNAPK
ncbi:MAG: preprotein translocase subunit SecG [Armatimonadota bacterium]